MEIVAVPLATAVTVNAALALAGETVATAVFEDAALNVPLYPVSEAVITAVAPEASSAMDVAPPGSVTEIVPTPINGPGAPGEQPENAPTSASKRRCRG
jgi:hypothetical protein